MQNTKTFNNYNYNNNKQENYEQKLNQNSIEKNIMNATEENITAEEFLSFKTTQEENNSISNNLIQSNKNQSPQRIILSEKENSDKNKFGNKFNTDSYSFFHGKIKMNWDKTVKANLVDKYFKMKHNTEHHFYGKKIKKSYETKGFNNIKELIGIYMIFQKHINKNELLRFESYFKIIIKSYESKYSFKSRISEIGKSIFIGGDLKDKYNLSILLKEQFYDKNENDNLIPIYMAIYTYNEYEFIELDGCDLCGKSVDHDGFSKCGVFNKDFNKDLSRKVGRVQRERRDKIDKIMKKEKEDGNQQMDGIITEEIFIK